jgi:hypothetical protein
MLYLSDKYIRNVCHINIFKLWSVLLPQQLNVGNTTTLATASAWLLCSRRRATALRVGAWKPLVSMWLLSSLLSKSSLLAAGRTAGRRRPVRGGATWSRPPFSRPLPVGSADSARVGSFTRMRMRGFLSGWLSKSLRQHNQLATLSRNDGF